MIDHTIVIAVKQVTDFNTNDKILALTKFKEKVSKDILSIHLLCLLIKNSSEIRKKINKMTLQ